ncbi:unnamed protein product [Nezara viridula]|uniref:Uncharacterized protein n=1 Tax=Nezara viridula TaxID=85310 RepID=A0A9P0HLD2_NEZVI|nr:unnamed protein product [Nezara viridula]
MVRVMPCLPTIGKIKLILDDVFKLSRWLGTYPIDEEYSSISKLNLAKGVILYFLASVIAIESLYGRLTVEEVPLSTIITQLLRILPIIILHWINLACLVSNRKLAKLYYDVNLWNYVGDILPQRRKHNSPYPEPRFLHIPLQHHQPTLGVTAALPFHTEEDQDH